MLLLLIALGMGPATHAAPIASATTPATLSSAALASLHAQLGQAQSSAWPTAQIAKLGINSLTANASFGFSVAISGDIAVVGAYLAEVGSATDAGTAYVFYRNFGAGDNWALVKQITATDGLAGDQFGFAVAISGDTVVVGAYYADIGGNLDQGAAYVFTRNQDGSNAWGQVKKLTALDGTTNTSLGFAVAISGDTIVVGANATPVGGAAYVFARNQGGAEAWGQVKRLSGSDTAGGDYFGTSVAISGDIIVVGAYGANVNNVDDQGAAYVFYRNNGGAEAWGQQSKLIAADGGVISTQFGHSVAISGDTVVVAAWRATVGSNPEQGAAYVFTRNQGGASAWGQVKKLVAPAGAANDRFGTTVAVSDDVAVIGARWADVNDALEQGKAYIYERNQGGADQWGHAITLVAADGAAADRFGQGVAISGNTVIIGAPRNLTTGAAYVYYRRVTTWGQLAKPTASGAAGDRLGFAVALDNDTLVVGADLGDSSGVDSGTAYVFERNTTGGDAWGLVKTLTAPDGAAGDHFGQAVSIADDTIVVGAPGKNSNQGAVYIFERNHPASVDNWGWKTTLTGTPGEQFGYAVAISGDRVAVGAPAAASGAVAIHDRNQDGINVWGEVRRIAGSAGGDQFGFALDLDNDTLIVGAPNADPAGLSEAGTAAIFERNTAVVENWGFVRELIPTDRQAGDHFGRAVALSDDTALAGAPDADPTAGVDAGAVYLFVRNQGGAAMWGQDTLLTDPQGMPGDRFGFAVDVHFDTAAVGAPRMQSGSNLNQGAALVFERNTGGRDAWGRVRRLVAADGADDDRFGMAVALGSAFLASGAIRGDMPSTVDQGAVYVFRTWSNAASIPLLRR